MRRLIILFAIFGLTLRASGQKQEKLLDSVSYFPRAVYTEAGNMIDSMLFISRSRMLSDFNESKLLTQGENSVYRFTWTRSFHEKMIIRLTLSGDSGTLITKTEIRKPIQEARKKSKVTVETKITYKLDSIRIEPNTISDFRRLINDKGFWKISSALELSIAHDGAGWLLEGSDEEKGYKMLYRHSPGQNHQDFKDICLFLIRLTKDSEKLEVY